MTSAIAFAIQALTVIPQLVEAGIAVKEHIDATTAKLAQFDAEKRDPTEQEWADQNARIAALRAQLHAG